MDYRVRQVLKLMEADLRRPVTLPELAGFVNLSDSRFRHIFKAETGKTPVRYLKELRLRQARHLAEPTFLSVKQIMNRVGICDASHFVRDFERLYGLSPARLRVVALSASMRQPQNIRKRIRQ